MNEYQRNVGLAILPAVEQILGGCEFKAACEVKRIVARSPVTQDWNC
jgi:hypothetical protein